MHGTIFLPTPLVSVQISYGQGLRSPSFISPANAFCCFQISLDRSSFLASAKNVAIRCEGSSTIEIGLMSLGKLWMGKKDCDEHVCLFSNLYCETIIRPGNEFLPQVSSTGTQCTYLRDAILTKYAGFGVLFKYDLMLEVCFGNCNTLCMSGQRNMGG